MRFVLTLLVSLLSGSAFAACPDPYTGTELATDLSQLGTSLRDQDMAKFVPAGARVEAGLICADKAFPRMAYASAYRYIGVAKFRSGDEAGARRWFRTALELEPTFNWDVDEMDFADPMRSMFEEERAKASLPPTARPGQSLVNGEGTQWYIDGRVLNTPEATPDRPHLLQQVNTADQSVVQSFIVDGYGFPDSMLKSTTVAAPAPTAKEKKNKEKAKDAPVVTTNEDGYQVVKVQRVRPPLKTPLIVLGGVGVLGSGALYGLSYLSHQDFEAATTTDDMLAAQKKTNMLVIASGSVLALSVGAGYVGVSLDTGPGWFIGARF